MRTTIDIDDPVLADLRRLQKREGKSLGRLASDLLAVALAEHRKQPPPPKFKWHAQPCGLLVDLMDKDAVWEILDRDRR